MSIEPSKTGPFPMLVFRHAWGWEVIQCGPKRFRLVSDYGHFGYIGCFSSKDAAVSYMNNEFL
jgi:hypothetical protein